MIAWLCIYLDVPWAVWGEYELDWGCGEGAELHGAAQVGRDVNEGAGLPPD